MSRIYFHNIRSTAAVSGAERALLGNYCSKALLFALGDISSWDSEPPWILKHIPPGHYLHQGDRRGWMQQSDIKTWLRVGSRSEGDDARLLLDGKSYPLFELQLNSALVMGGDALKFAARIHGQCEIHCYVEGENRAWLAGIIRDGLAKTILREDVGWQGVCDLLVSADDSPVVCSYSVCESFPGYHIADWPFQIVVEDGREYREYDESWYNLPAERQWEISMAALRESSRGLELEPEGWNEFFVGQSNVSGFDFANATFKRVQAAKANSR